MSEGRERPERLGVSEYHILFDPLWVGQHIPSQGCPTRKGSWVFVALFTPIHRALPSNGGYDKSDLSEVLTALSDLSDLSDEGTYKEVTDVNTALAVALSPFQVDRFSSYLAVIHHN